MKANGKGLLRLSGLFFLMVGFACRLHHSGKNDISQSHTRISTTIRNITFIFPASGYAYDHRDSIISACFQAIDHDLYVLHQKRYADTITAEFVDSREEMKKNIGGRPSGEAYPQFKKVWFVANKDSGPPIKHEFMHMISIGLWGQPPPESDWMKEGIAAFAENSCNGFTVQQIYAFFLKKNMLIPIDSLSEHFYGEPEMIAYHQSAYIVQYLIEHFGIQKLGLLWQTGIRDFEKIYGIPFRKVLSDIDENLNRLFPYAPAIDWNSFKIGCY
jgi:hypothetical protein